VRAGLVSVAVLGAKLSGCGEGAALEPFALSGRPNAAPGLDDRVPILWVETGVCTGCGISLLGSVRPPIEELLPAVRLEFQETLMDRGGEEALEHLEEIWGAYAGRFVLLVDGAIPTGDWAGATVLGRSRSGAEVTAEVLVQNLASRAKAVLALGTCASHGGIPAAGANPLAHRSLARVLGRRVIRIPGCPPHSGWIAGTLSALLSGSPLELDELGRPIMFYGKMIHQHCPRRPYYLLEQFATAPGDPEKCLLLQGCKGTVTPGDCPARPWNGQSSCLQANHPCIGCANPTFPDVLL
jgi:NiFe hydrogenase small subunit HydA